MNMQNRKIETENQTVRGNVFSAAVILAIASLVSWSVLLQFLS